MRELREVIERVEKGVRVLDHEGAITGYVISAADWREIRAEMSGAGATFMRLLAVHARYFGMDGRPGYDDTDPEPEDVWRYDRDFRAALSVTETNEEGDTNG